MKIILSRKGFDSQNGSIASPIYPKGDGLGLYSLPIPLENRGLNDRYEHIQWNGRNLHDLITSLRPNGELGIEDSPHLDPDLVHGALKKRPDHWRPIFGQSGGQETQLRNRGVGRQVRPGSVVGANGHQRKVNGVGEGVGNEHFRDGIAGPLFLFFGWFRNVEESEGQYSYAPPVQSPDIHAFFGWLQTAQKVSFAGREDREAFMRNNPWAAQHPHVASTYYDGRPNAIYIAPEPDSKDDRLNLDGTLTDFKASGMFSTYAPDVHQLTLDGQTRTNWRLPAWFFHRNGNPTLGMHGNLNRWQAIPEQPGHIHLRSVDIGQEFVFDSCDYDRKVVHAWVKKIIEAGRGRI